MRALRWMFAAVACGLFSTVIAAPSGGITVSYFEPLQRLSMRMTVASTSQQFQETARMGLSFDALGKTFNFQLEPNSGFLSPAARKALPDDIGIYRGHLVGAPDSWARIVIFAGTPRGVFWDGRQMYAIEAPGDSIVSADEPVIYRLADTMIESGTMSCGTQSFSGNGAAVYGKILGELSAAAAQGPGAVKEISVGVVGDFEFTTAQGGDVAAAVAISTRLNIVDGIYSQEIGVLINVPLIETYSDVSDPFTDETDPVSLLNELASYRQGSAAQNSLGLTHLYTGRNLDGTTVGIAFENTLCSTFAGAGLSEGNGTPTFDALVAAHEIGHNFGATHDGVPGACEAEPMTFIMAPMLNGSMQFSPCSIAIMQANAASAFCVTALPTVDMSVVLSGQPATVFLGNSPELTIDLSNNGASQATNVVADITLPNNVSFVSATASSGSCSNGAGIVNCQLGNIPGVTTRTVTLTTTAAAVGTGSFDVTVASDFDERPGNNQSAVQLTVDPAVDLVINSPSRATVNLEQSTTVSSILENRSIMDATGVSLSISLSPGIQAESATWSIGSCTVTAQQVDCQTANFANQSSSTFNIGITGRNVGDRSFSMTLSSNEADADVTNNSLSVTVSVNDPDDGGGALGIPFLLLLALAVYMTRRRQLPAG